MNRQTKRLMQKDQERKAAAPRTPKAGPGSTQKRERTKPRQFVKEVGGELRKVAWPTRQEVVAYSLVVLVSSIFIAALIFAVDYVFTKGVLFLFGIDT